MGSFLPREISEEEINKSVKERSDGEALFEKLASEFKEDLEQIASELARHGPIMYAYHTEHVLRAAKELLNRNTSKARIWKTLKEHGY